MIRIAAALVPLIAVPAFADRELDDALAAARSSYPATDVRAVRHTPLPGIYEFDMGGETVYGDIDARYLILGRLLDMHKHASSVGRRASLADYSAAQAASLVLQEGDGKEVVVFSDPLCGYCARLEQRLMEGELDGFTVRLVLVPLLPGSHQAAAGVLCAANPVRAYRQALLSGANFAADCKSQQLAEHIRLAERIGIQATPTFMGPAGYLKVGLPAPGELALWVNTQQVGG